MVGKGVQKVVGKDLKRYCKFPRSWEVRMDKAQRISPSKLHERGSDLMLSASELHERG